MEEKLSKEEMLSVISENIKKIEDKTFNVYFYVYDTKGYSNGSLEYLYQTAYELKEMGYNVTMIHNEEEFVGVKDWLGDKYAELPHKNVNKDNISITASDFLFIPEVFAGVMGQTKKLPCKRVLVLQNHRFLCEFFPIGVTPYNYNISECITTTEFNKAKLAEYFNGIKTSIVRPAIKSVFRPNEMERDLVINIVSDNKADVNRIAKPFYWAYPIYKWVSFRDLRGLNEDTFAEALRSGAITICINEKPSFGYSILEALRCGSIVFAKVPEHPVDWMLDENGELISSVIWFDNVDVLPSMLSSVVRTWTLDNMPSELMADIKSFGEKIKETYGEDCQKEDIKNVYCDIFERRLAEFNEVKKMIENNTLK